MGYTNFVLEKGKYTKEGNKSPKEKDPCWRSFSVIGTDGEFFSVSDLSLSE